MKLQLHWNSGRKLKNLEENQKFLIKKLPTRTIMNKNTVIIITALLLIPVLYFSCNTQRQIIKQPLKEQGPDYIFEQLKKNELKFRTLSGKFSAQAEINGDNNSFSGNIFIIKDSIIWVSIQKLGLEVARILLSTDSARFMNRINKTYFISDFNYVNQLFKTDFDFDIVQAILIGNDLSYYDNNKFRATIENMQYKLSTFNRAKLKKSLKKENDNTRILIQDIWLDPFTFKINKILIKEVKNENRKFIADYSNFQTIDNQLFPEEMNFQIIEEKKIKIKIEFSKISFNSTESMPFKIPNNYKKGNNSY